MAHWKFLDYVDDGGTNEIEAWIEGLQNSEAVRIRLRGILDNLQDVRGLETSGYVEPLTGNCSGLLAIEFVVRRVRHRPMGFKGPGEGEMTLLVGAVKAGDAEYKPRRACDIAFERQAIVEMDRKRVSDHDYTQR